MKKIKYFPIILMICLIFAAVSPAAYAVNDPEITANAVVLADLNGGDIIYSRNMDAQVSPASLTKIMTVLIAVEAVEQGRINLTDVITAQADCRAGLEDDSSTAGIQPGEQLSFGDLLYCAMVYSANEACNVIGTQLAGSVSAFVELMNERAAQLGCTGTHFLDPNGLSNEGHYTTAYDMYLIAREAVSHELFMSICNTVSYVVPATNMSEARSMQNSNALISTGSIYGSGYFYEYAAGVKTGYTRAAGYCLVSTAQKDGKRMMAVVMGCRGQLNTGDTDFFNFVDSRTLYDWVFDNFSYQTVVSTELTAATVNVELAEGDGVTALHPEQDITMLLPNDADLNALELHVTTDSEKLVAPIPAGTVLGEAEIFLSGNRIGTVKLVNNAAVDMSKKEFLAAHLRQTFSSTGVRVFILVLVLLMAGYFALVIRYRRLRQKHLREKRLAEQRRRMAREQEYARPHPIPDEPTQRFDRIDPDERYTRQASYDEIFKDR